MLAKSVLIHLFVFVRCHTATRQRQDAVLYTLPYTVIYVRLHGTGVQWPSYTSTATGYSHLLISALLIVRCSASDKTFQILWAPVPVFR
jgi:hypothetical protein